ncbi:hypothetical protein B0T21DRAFT_391597 [Apiosordaria backusii]|uniref:Uncharacterized protein n=1 Tax=Apiosordaria backusii TaxID=314023 RepID=A0AA40EIQ9_9PEZI|nr:hypothetical protein B0T21DRAFT_391597 [Apiosordaria backusii]
MCHEDHIVIFDSTFTLLFPQFQHFLVRNSFAQPYHRVTLFPSSATPISRNGFFKESSSSPACASRTCSSARPNLHCESHPNTRHLAKCTGSLSGVRRHDLPCPGNNHRSGLCRPRRPTRREILDCTQKGRILHLFEQELQRGSPGRSTLRGFVASLL